MASGAWLFLGSFSTGMFTMFGILLKYYLENQDLKDELTAIQNQIKTDISLSLPEINSLDKIINQLFEKTKVDRFVIFKAENGGVNPLTFTTAILERHSSGMYMMLSLGATKKYIRVRFDPPYKSMLDKIEMDKSLIYLDVEEMQECDLKTFYQEEQVKHSAVSFQARYPLTNDKHIILYYSFATHNEKPYSKKEKSLIRMAAEQIAGLNYRVTIHK